MAADEKLYETHYSVESCTEPNFQPFRFPEHLIIDVDGVLTDGKYYYNANGKLYKSFSCYDTEGLYLLEKIFKVYFITRETEPGLEINQRRVYHEWNYFLHQDHGHQRKEFIEHVMGLDLSDVAFIGDSWCDIPTLQAAKIAIVPENSPQIVQQIVAEQAYGVLLGIRGGEGVLLKTFFTLKEAFKEEFDERLGTV